MYIYIYGDTYKNMKATYHNGVRGSACRARFVGRKGRVAWPALGLMHIPVPKLRTLDSHA